MWGQCSFLLGPGVYKVLFVSSKSLFLQSCVSSGGFMVGLMATSSKRVYAIPRSTEPRAPAPASSPLLMCTSTGDTQTQFCLSLCWVSGSWCAQDLFEPSELLWQVRGLFLNVIWPLIPSSWGFSFALGCGVSLFGGIQHPPVNGCSAVSCSFGVLTGEDECTSFCSAIFQVRQQPLLLQGSGTSAQ